MKTNRLIKLSLASCLAMTLANGEMLQIEGKSGVTLDTETGLFWQDNYYTKTVKKDWQGAIDYCENLKLAGFDDWKLPDKDSLKALYLKKDGLQNVCTDNRYWSSSPVVYNSNWAWFVNFSYGYDNSDLKHDDLLVRCVRDSNFDSLTLSLFLQLLKTSNQTEKSIVLSSSRVSESALFLVKKDDKNYFGTQNELRKQFGMSFSDGYSKAPFANIQKITQKNLNDYLTIVPIPLPILPKPLALTKDEFESKAKFAERVKSETASREAEILRLQDEFRSKVEARNQELENRKANIEVKKNEYLFDNFALVMGAPKLSNPVFDAETETMFVDVSMSNANWSKNVGIKMDDLSVAKALKNNINNATSKVTFEYENGAFVLKNIDIKFENKNLVATLNQKDFIPEKVAVTIENKKVAFNELQNPNLVDKYQVSALGYGESNTAKGLKYTDDLTPLISKMAVTQPNPKNWLFAVAIENYDEADAVIYANNSAKTMISAMQKRLGISERNTYSLIDEKATGGAIKGQLERLLENVKEGDNIYFYYSGHGIPSGENGEAFILPKDVIADYVTKEKEFMARNIYKKLSDSKAGKIVAFVDSCYSGKTDGISNIKGVAAGVFKTKKVEFDSSKMVVFTAGTNGQFSNAYSEKGQRLFSYFVAKGLATRPDLDINSLYQEVSVGVKDESFKMGDNKRQVPQIEGNTGMGL
jgi:hypothetical protein